MATIYLSDAQQPALHLVFDMPRLEKPKSSFSAGDQGGAEATASAAALGAVIQLLAGADTSEL
jgi:hypothetical protein